MVEGRRMVYAPSFLCLMVCKLLSVFRMYILTSVRYNEKESILNRKKSVACRHSGLRPGIQYMQPLNLQNVFS